MSYNPMFGDDSGIAGWRMDNYAFPNDWTTYYPSDVQWEVARQMNADWARLRNQEITITKLQSDLSSSRAECERLRADAERLDWLDAQAADGVHLEVCYSGNLDARTLARKATVYVGRPQSEHESTSARHAINQARTALEAK